MKGRVQTVRIALHQSDSALHVLQYPSGWHLCYNHSLRQFPFSLRRSRPHKRRYLWKSRLYLNSKTYKILTKWYHDITKPSSTFQDKTKKMSKCHTKTHSSRQNNAFQNTFPFEGKVGTKCSAFSGKCLRHWLRRALGYPWKCLRHFLRLTVGWGVARVKNRFHSRNFLRRKSLVSSKTKKSVAKSNATFFAEFLPLWNALWFLCYKVFIFISL